MKIRRETIFTAVVFLALTAWGTSFMCFFPAAQIETAALFQPHRPSGFYTRPIEVKGVVRYLTREQKARHDLFQRISLGGWVVTLLTGIALWRLEKQDSNPPNSNQTRTLPNA